MKKFLNFKGSSIIITIFSILLINLLTSNILINNKLFNTKDKFNILVINTYDSNSQWEQFVLAGAKNKLTNYPQITLEVEYLDIRKRNDKEYLDSFLNLLNLKYKDSKINAVFSIDDEAFNFARENLFNDTSIFFHTPIIFSGVNNYVNLTDSEKDYITGIIEIENDLELFDMILNIHKDTTEINIILDNTIYSNIIKNKFSKLQDFLINKININIIQGTYIEDITDQLKIISKDNQVNIIIGDFISYNIERPLLPNETIDNINAVISSPIYTKSQPYVTQGAIGGIVDWGQEHGNVVGDIIINLFQGKTPRNIAVVYGSLEKIVFNYKRLDKYNINPMLLPKDALFINKGPFNFLLIKPLRIIIWIAVIIFFALIAFLIYKVTKNKATYLKQKKLLIQVQESERLKTEFITNISHELRTPLNIIINAAKLVHNKIDDKPLDKDFLHQKLDFIGKNSNRLLRLINNVIDLSKIESGYLTADLEMKNIVEIVEDTVMLTVDFAKNQGITITFDTEEEEINSAIDVVKLERVLLNLISNAIKFTPSSGFIDVNLYTKQNIITIEIKDTGIGIPKKQLSQIFERFNQVDTSLTRENEGSGLGLSISKALINILNGTLTVTSTENVGSTFTITLPITKITKENENISKNINYLEQIVNLELSDIKDKH